MLKIFTDVRVNRNKSLLDILATLAKAKNPMSPYDINKKMGRGKAYSNIHKNTLFLEQKGYIAKVNGAINRRRKKLFVITIKGILASIFSESIKNAPELLKRWREKNWGPDYEEAFRNAASIAELKRLVETLYLYGTSLDDIDEDVLKRGIRNPEEAISIITNSTLNVERRINESGSYLLQANLHPGTVATHLISNKDKKMICFMLSPDEKTNAMLFDSLSQNLLNREKVSVCLLKVLQTIARDLVNTNDRESVTHHYLKESRTFVMTGTIPKDIATLLNRPEQMLDFAKVPYHKIINRFREGGNFVEGSKALFAIQTMKYDPLRRILTPLSKEEKRQKIPIVLEQMRQAEF